MIKRVSLVWKRSGLSDTDFQRIWLGEHVEYAKQLRGVREYTIDFSTGGPKGAPDAIATLRFDTREALDTAFSDPQLNDQLMRTREQFASNVQVMIVDEHVVLSQHVKASSSPNGDDR